MGAVSRTAHHSPWPVVIVAIAIMIGTTIVEHEQNQLKQVVPVSTTYEIIQEKNWSLEIDMWYSSIMEVPWYVEKYAITTNVTTIEVSSKEYDLAKIGQIIEVVEYSNGDIIHFINRKEVT